MGGGPYFGVAVFVFEFGTGGEILEVEVFDPILLTDLAFKGEQLFAATL